MRYVDLGAQVARALRQEIVAGSLEPGSRLVETSLSERFDVSRGPVRDALRELEAEGLVESSRRGSFVVGLSERDLSELYSLRGALEAFALRSVAASDEVDWRPFGECVEAMSLAADRNDAEAFAEADLRFHHCFYAGSGNRRLLLVWVQMEPTFKALLDFTNAQDRDLHPAFQSHRFILESIRSGRIDAAVDELTVHLDGSQARIVTARAALIARADAEPK